jgi:hypothetical protein
MGRESLSYVAVKGGRASLLLFRGWLGSSEGRVLVFQGLIVSGHFRRIYPLEFEMDAPKLMCWLFIGSDNHR